MVAAAKTLAQRLQEEVQGMLDKKKEFDAACEEIDGGLREIRNALSWGNAKALPVTAKEEKEEKKPTISAEKVREWALSAFKKSGRTAQDESDIAIQMRKAGFDPDLDEEELVRFVYAEVINPLVRDGKIEPVGEPPNRKYRYKK